MRRRYATALVGVFAALAFGALARADVRLRLRLQLAHVPSVRDYVRDEFQVLECSRSSFEELDPVDVPPALASAEHSESGWSRLGSLFLHRYVSERSELVDRLYCLDGDQPGAWSRPGSSSVEPHLVRGRPEIPTIIAK